jgi:hypothetical protein
MYTMKAENLCVHYRRPKPFVADHENCSHLCLTCLKRCWCQQMKFFHLMQLLYAGYFCVHCFSNTYMRNNRSSRSAGPWRRIPRVFPRREFSVRESILPIGLVPSYTANAILDVLNEHFGYHVVCYRFHGRFFYGWVLATIFSGSQPLKFLYYLKICSCAWSLGENITNLKWWTLMSDSV